ncbi:RING-type E3 ubiquitin transferase [Malassezia japonica]|uniref:RING-type E3 ubiquitin transferase n=1 Tax=Malassezia japonica TaxID=223818 RepID=A0AAF0J9Y7_9BASI|nr:RING-type E3 ubiquitin transferase [Malassezia japonica]WFD39252.1 RING-type E3 ubiquitin transferase [Malassezia japonica]
MPRAVHASALVSAPVLACYGTASTVALAAVLLKAGLEQPDYFAAAAWITNSNGCFLVLLNFVGFVLLLSGRITQLILLGPLRRSESERFAEQLWYQLFDMSFTLTMFPIDFDLRYVLLAAVLKFTQLFHNLCGIRIEHMGQVPVLPPAFHTRMVALLAWLGATDVALCTLTLLITAQHFGPGSFMVYMSSISVLALIDCCALVAKYACECYELRQDEPWHAKSRYLFFIDLFSDLLKFITYPLCYGLFIYFGAKRATFFLPFSAVRDFGFLGFSLFKKVRELMRFRAATRDMETRYPTLSQEEVQALQDPTCIICREELVVVETTTDDNNVPKKLVCGHAFHFRCLHSWLERQQSCPTCRRNVLEDPREEPHGTQGEHAHAGAAPAQDEGAGEPADAPQRGPATLQGLLTRFPAAPGPAAGQAPRNEALFASPSAAARAMLDSPHLDPRTVDGHAPAAGPSRTVTAETDSDGVAPQSGAADTADPSRPPEDAREAVRRATLARFGTLSKKDVAPAADVPTPSRAPDLAAPTVPACEPITLDASHTAPVEQGPAEQVDHGSAAPAAPATASAAPAAGAAGAPPAAPMLIPLFDPATVPNFAPTHTAHALPGWVGTSPPASASHDTQLHEQLRLLQESQIQMQQSIARLADALQSSDKGKARTSEET